MSSTSARGSPAPTAAACSPTPAPTSSRSRRPSGDPWRRGRPAVARSIADEGGALFRFLHHGVRSVVGSPRRRRRSSSCSPRPTSSSTATPTRTDAHRCSATTYPGLVVLLDHAVRDGGAVADGRSASSSCRPSRAVWSGAGRSDQVPFQAGGRTSEWLSGTFASVAVAAAALARQRTGHGEDIDFAISEVMTIAANSYAEFVPRLARRTRRSSARTRTDRDAVGRADPRRLRRLLHQLPRQQFDDFLSADRSSRPASTSDLRELRGRVRTAGTNGTRSSTSGRRSTPPPRSCSWRASCASRLRRCSTARTSSTATTSSPAASSSTTRRVRSRCRVARGAWTTKTRRRRVRRRGSASTPGTIEPRASSRPAVADGDAAAAAGGPPRARPHRVVGGADRGRHDRRARRRRDPRRVDRAASTACA